MGEYEEDPAAEGGCVSLPIKIALGILAVAGIAQVALPNLVSTRPNYNFEAAYSALRTIGTSQNLFREGDKENDGNLDYGTLSELGAANLISQVLASGTKQGYRFEVTYGASTSEFVWYATATPNIPGTTGDYYFAANHEGVTFYTYSGAFSLNSADCTIPAGAVPYGK